MMDAVAAEYGWPAWPPVAAEERPGAVVGGWDLSEGAEPVPVSWVNEVGDGARPPQIAYVRRCVDVDHNLRVFKLIFLFEVGQVRLVNDRCSSARARDRFLLLVNRPAIVVRKRTSEATRQTCLGCFFFFFFLLLLLLLLCCTSFVYLSRESLSLSL